MPPLSDPTSRRILTVTEEELNRIVLDVHDGPVQSMFAALSLLAKMQHDIETIVPESPELLPTVNRVTGLIESALHDIKFFLGTFRSPKFRDRSLTSIIESLVIQHEEWTGHQIELTVRDLPKDVVLAVKIALYRILQEALSNIYRHAEVDRLWVKVWGEDDMIGVQVFDYGRGFDPPPLDGPNATEREEHIGLRGMRERVNLLGGTFHLTSRRGQGTTITVKVPSHE